MRVADFYTHPRQRKKQLLYLTVCDPDLQVTGATVRMGAFVKHLVQYYDVTLVNMAGSGYHVDPAISERFRRSNSYPGLCRRFSVPFSKSGYFLFSPTLYRAANKMLRNGSFDYILADYGLAAVYGTWFASVYNIPLIYSSHNVEFRMYIECSRYDFRRAMLAPYVYSAERAACRASSLVVAISNNDARQYRKWIGTDKIEVIPQGFDPELCNPLYAPPPALPATIVFVGNFRSEHNRSAARKIVKEILPIITRTLPDTKFQLIGADPPEDLKLPNVDCPGFVDDLGPYLRRANLVLAPMPFAHGMATKIVTALAFGKTVLATPEGASAISCKYRQLAVAPLEAFPGRILELLATRPTVDGGEFKALCEEFAWSKLIARLHRRIEESCPQPVSRGTAEAKVC
jgi:hypothetical protein